jgi:hypothetical protein
MHASLGRSMKLTNSKSIPIFVFILLTVAGLACNMPDARVGSPPPPREITPPSVDALESFNDKWLELNQATPDGPFVLTFTEAELTSVVVEALEEAELDSGLSLPVQDVQIILDDDIVYAYGTADLDPLAVDGVIEVVPEIGADGFVDVTIQSVEFGPLEIDPGLAEEIAATVEASINEPLQASQLNITFTDIVISDGELTVSGMISP